MRVTMDRVGRLVVPKSIREELGVGPDSEFEAVIDGASIRLEPVATSRRQVVVVDGWPCLSGVPGAALTDEDVRAIRDADRR